MFVKQALHKPCQEELISELVSEITETTESAHEPQHSESFSPRLWFLNTAREEEEDERRRIFLLREHWRGRRDQLEEAKHAAELPNLGNWERKR